MENDDNMVDWVREEGHLDIHAADPPSSAGGSTVDCCELAYCEDLLAVAYRSYRTAAVAAVPE